MTVTAYIALGANLGDRRAALEGAVQAVGAAALCRVVRVSRWIETEPVGGPPQPPFLNGAAEVETLLGPRAFLDLLLAVERSFGRERRVKWGPRTLDLDLLLWGDAVIVEPGLTVPHPRMRERRFVLEPLSEIAPDIRVPGAGATVRELLLRHGDMMPVFHRDSTARKTGFVSPSRDMVV